MTGDDLTAGYLGTGYRQPKRAGLLLIHASLSLLSHPTTRDVLPRPNGQGSGTHQSGGGVPKS